MRNYHIISVAEPASNVQGYQKVLSQNIVQIINHSADNILCTCLEYQDKNNLKNIVLNSLSKLKPNGQINISITNFKKVFEDFLSSKLPSSQIFALLKGKNDIIIIEEILSILDINTFKVMNINYVDYNINIVIERMII